MNDRPKRLPTLAAQETCTGCSACHAACAVGALTMAPDGEGFLRPTVDAAKCVGCGACERACPVLAPGKPNPAPLCFAARTRDAALLKASASGGMFTELALPVLEAGGVVFGCRWEDSGIALTAIHAKAETVGELAAMRGSKYVQSDVRETFREARESLRAGRRVLYTGTPCQIAGLLRFLGKPNPNLLTVELICHATCSPMVLQRFCDTLTERHGSRPVDLSFRDKNIGSWSAPMLGWRLANGRSGKKFFYGTGYGMAFAGLAIRPSCWNCVAKQGASGADLTIGDLWGVDRVCPAFDDGLGVSVIAAHTEHGRAVLKALLPRLDAAPLTPEAAFRHNPRYAATCTKHPRRDWFMAHFRAGSFERVARRAQMGILPIRLTRRILSKLRREGAALLRKIAQHRGGAVLYL